MNISSLKYGSVNSQWVILIMFYSRPEPRDVVTANLLTDRFIALTQATVKRFMAT